jgi:hypothetical protein
VLWKPKNGLASVMVGMLCRDTPSKRGEKQPGRSPGLVTRRESHKGQVFILQRQVRIASIPTQISLRSTISPWVVGWVVQCAESIVGLFERQNSTHTLVGDAYPSCLVVWGVSVEVMTAIQAALPEAWLSR